MGKIKKNPNFGRDLFFMFFVSWALCSLVNYFLLPGIGWNKIIQTGLQVLVFVPVGLVILSIGLKFSAPRKLPTVVFTALIAVGGFLALLLFAFGGPPFSINWEHPAATGAINWVITVLVVSIL